MSLRLRFNLFLVVSYVLVLALSAFPFYELSRRQAIGQLQSQIDLLRAQASAMRRYTAEEIAPLLDELASVQFLPQSVSSFSVQTLFRDLQDSYPQFRYREAAVNPTNPEDVAQDWEREIIERMRQRPDLDRNVIIRAADGGAQYTVIYPIVITDENCLACHSTPERAPASMTALYGTKNGFGWKLNDTIGAQIISVPMTAADDALWHNLWQFIGVCSAIFLALLVLVNALLNRYVIRPITLMARTAEAVSLGDSSPPEFQYSGTDEVASLSRSFNRMRRSLDSAIKMLEK
jgi:protein-histidine pros-kinase